MRKQIMKFDIQIASKIYDKYFYKWYKDLHLVNPGYMHYQQDFKGNIFAGNWVTQCLD